MIWPRIRLGQALETAPIFVDGDWVESKDQDPQGDVRLIQLADVGEGFYIDKSNRFLTSAAADRLKCTFLEPGDILLARMPDPLGRACIFPGDSKRAVTVVDVCVIRVDKSRIDARWLMHCINSPGVRSEIGGYVTGTTRSRISRGNLSKVEIPLPPFPEQRRIAAILDQADALKAKRREALVQLDSLTQSILIEMFGDPVENPKCWPTIRLGDHTAKMGSGATPTGGDAAYKTSGISLIRSLNVRDGVFAYKDLAFIDDAQAAKLSNVVVCAGDVLLNITGASVARVCRAPIDVLPARVNQHVMVIRPKSTVDGVFLERMLLSRNMKRLLLQIGGSGATREAITKAQASELTVICPPLALQQTFATRIQAVESLKTTHRAALAESNALFASLQHRAFAGQLLAGQRPAAFATIAPCAPPTP